MNDSRAEFALAARGVSSSSSSSLSEVKCNLIRTTTTTAIKRSRLLQTTVIYKSGCQATATAFQLPMTMTTTPASSSSSSPSSSQSPSSSAHSQLHPIHHHRRQRPRQLRPQSQQCHQQWSLTKSAAAKAFKRTATAEQAKEAEHKSQTNNSRSGDRQSCLLPLTFRLGALWCFLLLLLSFPPPSLPSSVQAADSAVESSNHPHHQHSKSHQKHRQHSSSSSILSTLLTFNELITAESIFPCLDTFDVVLMRSTDGHQLKQPQQPNPLATKRQHQQQQPEGKLRQQQSDNGNDLDGQDGPNRTRQLVRVYTASKEVVEEIAAATEHHLATDRLYPVKNHHHSHHKYRRRRPNHHHQNHHHHHHHPLRPSMLIELRQLQYVREYHLPVRSQLLRVRCDVFEPAESIYYCFIYVVLHRGAVHFESLPYCVPTTLTASSTAAEDDDDEAAVGDNGDDQSMMMKRKSRRQKQRKIMMRRRGPALSGVNNRISGNGGNGRRPLYPFLIDPPSTPSENEQQQKQKQKQQQQHLITLGRADLIANDSSSSSSPTQKWYQMNDDHRQSGGQQHYSLQTDNSISEHFNNDAERKVSADEAGTIENGDDYDYDPLQQIRSLIPPPGPAAFGSARTRKDEEESEVREDQMNSLPPDNAVDYEETAELDHRSTKEKEDNNIRQFALKSSDSLPSSSSSGSSSSLQSDYHRQQQQQQSPIVVGQRIGGNNGNNSKGDKVATQRKKTTKAKTKKTPALSVQRRSCYCSNSADLRPSSSSTSSTSILRLNLTTSETTVLHLVITSCPAASEEEEDNEEGEENVVEKGDNSSSSAVADDDENLLDSSGENAAAANYISGSSESGRHLKEAEVITTATTSTAKTTADKEATKANNNKTKKDRRKGKGKKERKDRKNHHQPTEPLSTTSTTSTTTTTTTSTTTTEASTSSSTISSSTTTTPTVCILSIENPLQYSFKLDSIEPSLDWPAGIFDGHSMQGGGLDLPGPEEQGGKAATGEGPLDFLDWLRRFPFLVVRSGQRAIDPQMNIENRSATHFLRSGGHLRFEALSSLNVTLRFRRSPQPSLAHTRDSQHTTLQHRQSSELEDNENHSSSLSSAFSSIRSAVDGAISYFAYHLAVNSAGDSGQPRTSAEDSAALAQLTAFHLTSMLLSLFILATLAIFAVIAYLQASKEEEGTRRVQIRTPQEEEEFDMDSSPRHHSQQQSSRASEDQQMMQQLYGSSSQQASTSRGSKHQHQSTKSPSFTLEQQSLEMDYYDYVAPLTIVEHHHHQQQQTLEHTSTADSSSTCHHFRTLPIKVNSPSSSLSRNKQLSLVKQNNTTTTNTTSSCCSLAAAASGNGGGTSLVRAGGGGGGQSSAACSAAGAQSTSGYVINDHNSQQQQQPNSNSGSSTEAERMVATLARLSFTKPPVLLSTFRPSAGAGE